MIVSKMTDEIRAAKELAKTAQPPKLNLRRVLDMISESKKPLIGHNCFLDLMQISSQFMWDLPFELEDWKKALTREWNTYVQWISPLTLYCGQLWSAVDIHPF